MSHYSRNAQWLSPDANVFPSLLEEFSRAVYVATGIKLTRHVVNTVFRIFDEDQDDKLSYKEFIGIMKDRLHRGNRVRQPENVYLCFMPLKGDRRDVLPLLFLLLLLFLLPRESSFSEVLTRRKNGTQVSAM